MVPIPRIPLGEPRFLVVAVPGVLVGVGVGVVCGVPGLGDVDNVDDDDVVVVDDAAVDDVGGGDDGVYCVSHHAGH